MIQRARLATPRLGLTRLGYVIPTVAVVIGGVVHTTHVRIASLTITDELNHEPNTATMRVDTFVPVVGAEVTVYLAGEQIFGGHIRAVRQVYEELPDNLAFDLDCIDYTWLLSRRKVNSNVSTYSAGDVFAGVVANFTSGFTSSIGAGLTAIIAIDFTNEDVPDALTRIVERVGGYWYVGYDKVVHAFVTFTEEAAPITDAVPRSMSEIAQHSDLSQIATRVIARGGGSNALVDVPAYAVTIPLEDDAWYSASGGTVQHGQQRITYTGKATHGTGSTVATKTATVPTAPTAANNATSGNLIGEYSYRVSFFISGGETLTGLSSNAVTVPAPTANTLVVTMATGGSTPAGTVSRYRLTRITSGVEYLVMESDAFTMPSYTIGAFGIADGGAMGITGIPLGPVGTTARKLYRSDNGGTYGLVLTVLGDLANNTDTSTLDFYSAPTTAMPTLTSGGARVDLSAIPLGPVGTTERRLYRTVGGGTAFKRLATISDNTTTTYADNIADGSLGVAAPAVASVGATAGEATLTVAELSAFPSAGWVLAGGQIVHYFSKSAASGAGTLRDIPASGTGAITAPLSVGAEVLTVPHLTGCAGINYPILKGDPINVVAIVNDTTAQAAMAAAIGSGDGVHEMFITDGRWSLVEATARATTELTQRKDPLTTLTYKTRDPTAFSGRTVTVTLTSPAISGTFKIQRVTISNFEGITKGVWPTRTVECSSRRYSFEDLLRQIRGV